MMKLRFLAGLAAGYVLGTREGRERYEQIVSAVQGSSLYQQVHGEVTKRTGSQTGARGAGTGTATPPVIVGPGPDAGTAGSSADVVLPDLEQSGTSATDRPSRSAGDAEQARRLDPPTTG